MKLLLQYRYVVLWVALLLAGCASLERPQTLNERLYYAQTSLTAATNTAADLRQVGILTEDQMPAVRRMVDDAYAALQAARLANGAGRPSDALGYLQTAQAILLQLQAYLRAHSVDSGSQS